MRRIRRGGARVRAALDATEVRTGAAAEPIAATASALRFRIAPGWLPPGRRVYAVGDVHGCREQLVDLHAAIAADVAARPSPSVLLMHLGDYIDIGPDSAGVIDVLARPSPITGATTVNLMGDHERMLLDALSGDRAAATDWLWAGGRASLASWGIDPDVPREQWQAALPASHVAFLRSLVLTHREGDYLFVHAGIRPGVMMAQQTPDDLLTMRQPFLWSDADFGAVVVHGHNTSPLPAVTGNRIGIDTGAGHGGPLTCVVLEEGLVGFLAA